MSNTERAIIDAAIIVLNDDLSAPMETIAEKAHVTRRTLHRYFKDRKHLLDSCKKEMFSTCKDSMNRAYNTTSAPLKQLELMLYAAIDCNYKYAFLNKLQQREQPKLITGEEEENITDNVKSKWRSLVIDLQKSGAIKGNLTPHWIFFLFDGMVTTAISALGSGDVAPNEIKKFAWLSFSNSIGIK
ncbi:TetR/AcrR family transcriptional regulator [Mucilaginibacter sp. SP1R1]|uniref:TetR/AcrR family transcriptional regulator n=1 Tax=Mucilaginibacter sp. SP1R1 TaxID=2723091 RepID=UPI001619F9E1|nr:TetR/AcrR family transcriptional regulator [Mucilaginibacter sp. SP1R1]MBB6149967.1 AcrR family transcriptional regulator [Mucilaginibacter sp. SP1R1]